MEVLFSVVAQKMRQISSVLLKKNSLPTPEIDVIYNL